MKITAFKKFKIKDIVFLAIISAIILLTGGVMPFVAHIPIFGVIQVALGIQFSLFPAIALMKVKKAGSLLFVAVFSGIVLLFMNQIMFFCLILCALLAETISLLIFKSYEKDIACFLASTLYLPFSLPFLYVWYRIVGGENTVADYANEKPFLAIVMSLVVIAICFLGSFLGIKISRELQKSGVLKK